MKNKNRRVTRRALCIALALLMLLTVVPLTVLAEKTKTYKTGDVIEFGSYPQGKVTDESIKAALTSKAGSTDEWTSYDYYIESAKSDFMKYIDVEYNGAKYRGVYFTKYRPAETNDSSSASNSYQADSGYSTSSIYWFKYEPMEWQVLSFDSTNGEAVVLSKYVLDSQQFYYTTSTRTVDGKTVYANNYEQSDIRVWLNDAFYDMAFAESEKNVIVATTLDNAAWDSSDSKYDSNSTTDNVWLLSYNEVQNTAYGFTSDMGSSETRKAKSTAYAICQGSYKSGSCTYWRLRSAGSAIDSSCIVYFDGTVSSSDVLNTSIGVRPALKLDLTSLTIDTATDLAVPTDDATPTDVVAPTDVVVPTDPADDTTSTDDTTPTDDVAPIDPTDTSECEHEFESGTIIIDDEVVVSSSIDIVFVVDTTGSMGDDIDTVKTDINTYLDTLQENDIDYRIALVDYRDFASRTYDDADYAYNVCLDFTDDGESIRAAVLSLSLGYGGDGPKTVYSGLVDGLKALSWRDDAGKAAIIMGDAEALDPEPFTDYTLESTAEFLKTYFSSPVAVFGIATGYSALSSFEKIAEATGGKAYSAASSLDITTLVQTIIKKLPVVVIIPGAGWQVRTPATCTTAGEEFRVCIKCKVYEETRVISPLGHDFAEQIVDDAHLASTATKASPAMYYYDCSRCDAIGTETFAYGAPVAEITDETTTGSVTESSTAPTTEPTAEPTTAETTTEPTAEPTTAETTTEPTAEPTTAETTTEPTIEPTTKPSEESTTKSSIEPTTKSSEESTTTQSEASTTKPSEESTTVPTTEPTAEPTIEPTTAKRETDTETESTTKHVTVPTADIIASVAEKVDTVKAAKTEEGDDALVAVYGTNAAAIRGAAPGAKILDKDGNEVSDSAPLATGMKIIFDGETIDVAVLGDVDGDAEISVTDARLALRQAVSLEDLKGVYRLAAQVGSDTVSVSEARKILRAAVGLEDSKDWLK